MIYGGVFLSRLRLRCLQEMGLVADKELGGKWRSLSKTIAPFLCGLSPGLGTILPSGLLHVGKTPS